jgi:photosystem II stability/assembly factor-like uncharacterized protein
MASDTIVLGTRKGVLLLKRTNGDWQVTRSAYPGAPFSYAAFDPRTGILWAAADHGHWGAKLYCSADEGQTWTEKPAPRYPEGEIITGGFPGEDPVRGQPAVLSYIWCIIPGPADRPGRIYIGTEPGGLFQSDDNGESFQLVRGLWDHPSRDNWFGGGRDKPGLCALVIDPRDSDHLYADISVGGVFESRDGGASWEPRNKGLNACYLPDPYPEVGHDPHFLAASPSNPDVLWQQNHCGVFRSVDGGANWTDISQPGGPVFFGFPIAVDAQDEHTAWVVPAVSDEYRMAIDGALCVGRTEDGGRTWTALRDGLPQENCFDVAYRHALDIRGDQLVFGTTTGNLFISEDRGDSWTGLGSHFPPIYSVRLK